MQEQLWQHNVGRIEANWPVRKTSPGRQPVPLPRQHPLRLKLRTLPPRRICLGRAPLLASLHAAELAAWQASGGDVLRSPRPN